MPPRNNAIPHAVLDAIQEGARLYNEGAYWEAHEAWEEAWHRLQDEDLHDEAHLTQALILATAAFENLRRGKPNGFSVQAAKALSRLRRHQGAATRLGLKNEAAFRDGLLTLYLEAQATRVQTLESLPDEPPRLAVGPTSAPEGGR